MLNMLTGTKDSPRLSRYCFSKWVTQFSDDPTHLSWEFLERWWWLPLCHHVTLGGGRDCWRISCRLDEVLSVNGVVDVGACESERFCDISFDFVFVLFWQPSNVWKSTRGLIIQVSTVWIVSIGKVWKVLLEYGQMAKNAASSSSSFYWGR